MLAFGRERRIEKRGNGDVEIRRGREFAVLRGVEGAFEIVDFGADVDAAGERLDGTVGTDSVGERGKSREIVEREIDFGDGAAARMLRMRRAKVGSSCDGIDEIEEGALGVDAGDDGFGGDFFAVGEDEAGDGAVFDANVLDFGLRANFRAGLARGVGERARERAESSARKCSGADGMRIGSGAQKKHGGAACRPRTERGAENAASGDDGAEQFGFEKFGDEIGDGHRAPAEQVEDAVLAEAADVATGLEEIPEIFRRWRIDRGRSDRRQCCAKNT